MTRLLASLALCALVTTTGAKAMDISFLGSLHMMPNVEASKDIKDCADFNGNWKGFCLHNDGKKQEQAFTVKQKGCEMVQVEAQNQKMVIPVGGVISMGGAMPGTPAVSFGGNLISHWNKEKNTLNVHVMGGGKKLAIDEAGKGFALEEQVRLVKGKMTVEMHAHGDSKAIALCEFDKQD